LIHFFSATNRNCLSNLKSIAITLHSFLCRSFFIDQSLVKILQLLLIYRHMTLLFAPIA
jgi:hypothetical protein